MKRELALGDSSSSPIWATARAFLLPRFTSACGSAQQQATQVLVKLMSTWFVSVVGTGHDIG